VIPLVKKSIENVVNEASRRNIHLNAELPKEFELKHDEVLFYRAINNLLTNAIKNTPTNGDVFIKVIEQDNFKGIIVEDTGVGIIKKERSKLFKKFGKIERIGKGMDIDIEGPGLGLYIANEIVKLHNGEININSKGRNEGSKFMIKLFDS
jgi:signal transduction histidine kinase